MRSQEVVDAIGISFRQLDYLTRRGVVQGFNGGSGNYRSWPPEVVVRLALANHLTRAIPGGTAKPFPDIAELVVDLPGPLPRRGYLVLAPDPDTVDCAARWPDVRRLLDDYGAALIVQYDLDDLVGEHIELAELVAT